MRRVRVEEVFDLAGRGGLVVVVSSLVETTACGTTAGVPRLRDEVTGRAVRVLGVDHPTPRTQRTGEVILVVDRADAEVVEAGRVWVAAD